MIGALQRRPWIALVVVLGLQLVWCLLAFGDYTPGDPVRYAQSAHDISQAPGAVFHDPPAHPFYMRVGLTLPLAALFRLLGPSPLVATLPMFASALVITGVVYAAAPTPRAKLVGLALALGSPALLKHAVMLGVDLPCAALVGVSVLCLARGPSRSWIAAAMLAWFAAFLVKETALWAAPIWIYAVLRDVRAEGRGAGKRYAPALAVGVVLGAVYLAVCARVWGDPWARFASVEALTGKHLWSTDAVAATPWSERLGWGPPVLFTRVFLASLVPVVAAPWLLAARDRIWWVATFALLGLFWFGSSSLSAYAPLPLLPRMAISALAPLLVSATLATDVLLDRLSASGKVVLAMILVVPSLVVSVVFTLRPHLDADAIEIATTIARDRPVLLVCGDPRCTHLVDFTLGFAPPKNLEVRFAPELYQRPLSPNVEVLVLVNLRRTPRATWYDPATDPRHYTVDKITRLGLPPLINTPSVKLYAAGNGARLWAALQ